MGCPRKPRSSSNWRATFAAAVRITALWRQCKKRLRSWPQKQESNAMPDLMTRPVTAFDRRAFLKSLGGGLLVLLAFDEVSAAQESGGARRQRGDQLPADVAAWLHIGPDGAITAFTGKVEVGQNIRTSLAQAVADELRCAPGLVQLV